MIVQKSFEPEAMETMGADRWRKWPMSLASSSDLCMLGGKVMFGVHCMLLKGSWEVHDVEWFRAM